MHHHGILISALSVDMSSLLTSFISKKYILLSLVSFSFVHCQISIYLYIYRYIYIYLF